MNYCTHRHDELLGRGPCQATIARLAEDGRPEALGETLSDESARLADWVARRPTALVCRFCGRELAR